MTKTASKIKIAKANNKTLKNINPTSREVYNKLAKNGFDKKEFQDKYIQQVLDKDKIIDVNKKKSRSQHLKEYNKAKQLAADQYQKITTAVGNTIQPNLKPLPKPISAVKTAATATAATVGTTVGLSLLPEKDLPVSNVETTTKPKAQKPTEEAKAKKETKAPDKKPAKTTPTPPLATPPFGAMDMGDFGQQLEASIGNQILQIQQDLGIAPVDTDETLTPLERIQKQRRTFDQKQFISKIEQQKGEAGVINYYADKIESYNRAISDESNQDRKAELENQKQNFKNEFLNAYSGDDIIDRRMPLAEKIKQFDELYLNKDQYRTSDVVKTTLLKLEEGEDAFDDWYLNMPPTFRQEMFEKMEQKGHLDKLPPGYKELHEEEKKKGHKIKYGASKFVESEHFGGSRELKYLTEQERKDPANIDKLVIPERVKEKLKKKRGNDLAKTYELDKSLFYAQWLNATVNQREAALKALESAEQNKAVEEFKDAVETGYIPGQSLSPAALKSLNIKKIAADYNVFPTFLREHLKTGKDLLEAIDAAKRKINPFPSHDHVGQA